MLYGFRLSERQPILVVQSMNSRTDQCQENNIKVLLEQLGSLKITKEDASDRTIETETTGTMLTAPASVVQNKQVVISKNMVLDPGWFDGDKTKFEDQQREI